MTTFQVIRALVLPALLAWFAPAFAGDLSAEVDAMFGSLSGVNNYTAPSAFKGQTMNTVSGGSLYARVPQRTYQLAAFEFPTIRAGCGGIDVFGGSFSSISGTEIRDMLRNITSALPGVAFNVVMKAVSPLLSGVMETFEQWRSLANRAQINSCEAASALVGSAFEAGGHEGIARCKKLAVERGLATDSYSAAAYCATNWQTVNDDARTSGDPDLEKLAGFTGNFTWQTLKRDTTLDDATRELIMSMVGTVIFPSDSSATGPDIRYPTLTSVRQILYGQADDAGNNVKYPMLHCKDDEYVDCLVVEVRTEAHESLSKKVKDMMSQIATHIRSRVAIPNNSDLVAFVNSTHLPVWSLLSVGSSVPDSGLVDTLINQYADLIAADLAQALLSEFIKFGTAATASQGPLSKVQVPYVNALRTDTQSLLAEIRGEYLLLMQKSVSISQISEDVRRLERSIRGSMAPHVMSMLGYSAQAGR